MTRLKIAEITSGVGALVLGVGLGALFPQWFAPAAAVIALAGVVAHAFGMWDKHRLEAQANGPSEPWVTALYGVCWLLLAGVVAFGCSPTEHARDVAQQLLTRGHAVNSEGHSVRMVAFGDVPEGHQQHAWTTVPMRHVVLFLRRYLKQHWAVLRHAQITADSHNPAIVLCDRGTVDGLAYWPGPEDFWSSVSTTLDVELARYDAVIHMRTPAADQGYNHQNPLRTESAATAADIDARIARAWERHPRRFMIESSAEFFDKAAHALGILRGELPDCCKRHVVSAVRDRHLTPGAAALV